MTFERPRLIHTLAGAQQYGSLQSLDRIPVDRPSDDLPGFVDPAALTGITLATRIETPYDHGATPGNELSEDNHPYVQAMFDAVAASFDIPSRSYGVLPSFAGAMFRCDDEVYAGGLRDPGCFIFGEGGGIYSNATGKIGLNLALCNALSLIGFRIWGDATNTPDYGIYFGRGELAGAWPDARQIRFTHCFAQGYFNRASVLRFASETGSHVNCLYQNRSRSLTAVAYASVGHRTALDNNLGGTLSSANVTLPTVASGTHSNINDEFTGCTIERTADSVLTIVSIPRGVTTTVTVETGTLLAAGYSNGDKVRLHNVQGMTELRTGLYTIANLNTGADTFDLSGVDSSSYGADATGGQVWSATGPPVLFNGAAGVVGETLYTLGYSEDNIVIDLSVGGDIRNFTLRFQPESKPDHVVKFILPSSPSTAVIQNFNLFNMSSNQIYGDSIFAVDGTGNLTIQGGAIEVHNLASAPPNLLFDNPANVSLIGVAITVPIEAVLNPASAYTAYEVTETAFDRFPKTVVHQSLSFENNPRFLTGNLSTPGLTVQASDDGATTGPLLDVERISATPAANDLLGAVQFSARNDAGEKVSMAKLRAKTIIAADGTERGQLDLVVTNNGVETTVASARYDGMASNGWIVQANHQATTAELENLADAVNTTNKHVGKYVWNTTTNRPCWAEGSAANAVWNDADGNTLHTPV